MSQSDYHTLLIITGSDQQEISLSTQMLQDARPILQKMDSDMDQGWQLGREFIASPNVIQRCQIVANRLLTALHTENQASAQLMTAFILSRLDNVSAVNINTEGESEDTLFFDHNQSLIG